MSAPDIFLSYNGEDQSDRSLALHSASSPALLHKAMGCQLAGMKNLAREMLADLRATHPGPGRDNIAGILRRTQYPAERIAEHDAALRQLWADVEGDA